MREEEWKNRISLILTFLLTWNFLLSPVLSPMFSRARGAAGRGCEERKTKRPAHSFGECINNGPAVAVMTLFDLMNGAGVLLFCTGGDDSLADATARGTPGRK